MVPAEHELARLRPRRRAGAQRGPGDLPLLRVVPGLDGGRMPERCRVIVIGCGAIGAATMYWLSRRWGDDGVLALEQYELGHGRGASEDHSRVIRHAYSRSDYTALTPAAYQSWNVAERETGLRLVHRTGGLIVAARGSAGMEYIDATAAARAASGLPFELPSGVQVSEPWPPWRPGDPHPPRLAPGSGVL